MDTANIKQADNSAAYRQPEALQNIDRSPGQRLRDCMENLGADLFDELDDFLFCSVQPEELGEGSSQLNLIREYRNKKQLFEEQFLGFVSSALQLNSDSENADKTVCARSGFSNDGSSAYEKMEIDLALERMQRKALKHYAARVETPDSSERVGKRDSAALISSENLDALVTITLQALAVSHGVFRVSLENRLVFLKLFEKHFLLQMGQLFQQVTSFCQHQDSRSLAERLGSSSVSILERDEHAGPGQTKTYSDTQASSRQPGSAEKLAARIDSLVDGWCGKSNLMEAVVSMMRNDWRAIMYLMGMNKGLDSSEWREAVQTIESLLQRIAGDSNPEGNQPGIDTLRKSLQQGFDLIQKPVAEQQDFFAALEGVFGREGKETRVESTSLISRGSDHVISEIKPSKFAAVSEAGRKILDHEDLDDFVALLSDDQEQAIAELDEEAISMDYYLSMVDSMTDGAPAELKGSDIEGSCRIEKSASIDDSYRVLDQHGRVLLTRGRVGLAVSLRAGEIRLQGQQDFKRSQSGCSQQLSTDNARTASPATAH
jgi:hypothetical protein